VRLGGVGSTFPVRLHGSPEGVVLIGTKVFGLGEISVLRAETEPFVWAPASSPFGSAWFCWTAPSLSRTSPLWAEPGSARRWGRSAGLLLKTA